VLPIHLRYQDPSFNATHRKFSIPPPLVYVRCHSGTPSQAWTRVAFDRRVSDAPRVALPLEVSVPVGEKQKQGMVTIATLLATTLGSAVVLVFLWRHRSDGDDTAKRE
jgi:hypothetical protein